MLKEALKIIVGLIKTAFDVLKTIFEILVLAIILFLFFPRSLRRGRASNMINNEKGHDNDSDCDHLPD